MNLKKLTETDLATAERKAWLKLADEYEANQDGTALGWRGICVSLNVIGRQSYEVSEDMRERMRRHKPSGTATDGYWWPSRDWQSRAAFCREMASLCEILERKETKV